jgi:hypothetical protein
LIGKIEEAGRRGEGKLNATMSGYELLALYFIEKYKHCVEKKKCLLNKQERFIEKEEHVIEIIEHISQQTNPVH